MVSPPYVVLMWVFVWGVGLGVAWVLALIGGLAVGWRILHFLRSDGPFFVVV